MLPGQLFTLRFPRENEIVDLLLVTHQDRSEIIVELKGKKVRKINKQREKSKKRALKKPKKPT